MSLQEIGSRANRIGSGRASDQYLQSHTLGGYERKVREGDYCVVAVLQLNAMTDSASLGIKPILEGLHKGITTDDWISSHDSAENAGDIVAVSVSVNGSVDHVENYTYDAQRRMTQVLGVRRDCWWQICSLRRSFDCGEEIPPLGRNPSCLNRWHPISKRRPKNSLRGFACDPPMPSSTWLDNS